MLTFCCRTSWRCSRTLTFCCAAWRASAVRALGLLDLLGAGLARLGALLAASSALARRSSRSSARESRSPRWASAGVVTAAAVVAIRKERRSLRITYLISASPIEALITCSGLAVAEPSRCRPFILIGLQTRVQTQTSPRHASRRYFMGKNRRCRRAAAERDPFPSRGRLRTSRCGRRSSRTSGRAAARSRSTIPDMATASRRPKARPATISPPRSWREWMRSGSAEAHICGLSLGGVIAIAIHAAAPERCASLILADSFAVHPDGQAIYERSVAASSDLRALAEARADILLAQPADPAFDTKSSRRWRGSTPPPTGSAPKRCGSPTSATARAGSACRRW
jgi:hypothetical protein